MLLTPSACSAQVSRVLEPLLARDLTSKMFGMSSKADHNETVSRRRPYASHPRLPLHVPTLRLYVPLQIAVARPLPSPAWIAARVPSTPTTTAQVPANRTTAAARVTTAQNTAGGEGGWGHGRIISTLVRHIGR